MWKNTVDLDKTQMTIQYGVCALKDKQLSMQADTQNM